MSNQSAIATFVKSVEETFDRGRIETIWDCRPAFEGLLAEDIAVRTINEELGRAVRNSEYLGDWRPNHLILHRGKGYVLSIARLVEPQRYIHTAHFYGFYASVDGQPIVYETFALPERYRNEVFDPTVQLTSLGVDRVLPGEVLELRTQDRAYDLKVPSPQLVLKLTTAPYHTLEWLFARDSLMAWQANDADLRSTQLRVGAYLLGRLADQSSVEPLRALTAHPNHSARWAAIQAIGRLSRSEALALLARSVDDPHPHIRRAAQKALAQLQKAASS